MRKVPPQPNPPRTGCQLPVALEQLYDTVIDGLCHGYFRITIFSRIVKGNKRELIIEAGKTYKFTIPEGDLPP